MVNQFNEEAAFSLNILIETHHFLKVLHNVAKEIYVTIQIMK
ncbi:hypothetical protein [Cytobacillus luteolus]|nr:hypothetical protein [Cytobacillus luteolus]MBP1942680.1 hypothetical protein [Cytobacillus luteolus]